MLHPRRASVVSLLGVASLVFPFFACSDHEDAPTRALDRDAAKTVSEAGAPKLVEPLTYDRDIRPLLSEHCFKCHGPDGSKREADLRLDEFAAATNERDGVTAIVVGDIERSELVTRIRSSDPDEQMPPPKSGKRGLNESEIALLERWITEGAKYEQHWSFVAPTRPAAPAVKNSAWVRNPVDAFVLSELEKKGIAPSDSAERRTLIRRVFLDLTGLPPTPEETQAFVADPAPDAYEKLVHRLLHDEPYVTRYAERMATPWLDAARYADTNGIHTDAGRQIWPWRDWVLRAFHDGLPFDRFVIEQMAGDLLPNATTDQLVASGFNRNHVMTDEGGAIPEEYLVEYAVDRVTTTSAVFFGLTVGCARCHDHKYDPITMDDFYSFVSYFNSIEEPGLYSQLPDSNRAFEPFISVPSEASKTELETLRASLSKERADLDAPAPQEDAERARFLADLHARGGIEFAAAQPVEARAENGATLTIQPDGSVLASGENPPQDAFEIKLCAEPTGNAPTQGLELVVLEALTDPSLPNGRVGRAFNGNAVLSSFEAEAISRRDPRQRETIRFQWAAANHEQENGDFAVDNLLSGRGEGWAVDGHGREGGRIACFLAEKPFGYEGGTDLVVKLGFRSRYSEHTLGRVRVSMAKIAPALKDDLPVGASRWNMAGPFGAASTDALYTTSFGPEEGAAIDFARSFDGGKQSWRHADMVLDAVLTNNLPGGPSVTYLGKTLRLPTPRKLNLSLGSDDGFMLFVDGVKIAENRVDRSASADQDQASVELAAGQHSVVMKVVNTGGIGGFYFKSARRDNELTGNLLLALLPDGQRSDDQRTRLARSWKLAFSSDYRARVARIKELEQQIGDLEARMPRTMVMRENPMPRETFVLMRGQYDKPDPQRKVTRRVPPAFGTTPNGAPKDRLELAQWMMSENSPLVARVTVNRLWEQVFGVGLVRTVEDFGLQGEWPSHRELLDWLAVEFREQGYDVKRFLTMLVTSATYRQSSRARRELAESDPENRLLAAFPRKRLWAEAIRDQALYTAGILLERVGGPSVKPYQPDGLWQEVAMPASNTRFFELGKDDELWRRSLYTYWKRACPPPALLTFDAPTREFCTVRRSSTNTPLQALVTWNDEQFVEAARKLAERTMQEATTDAARLHRMFERLLARAPDAREAQELSAALADFRTRYRATPQDANDLLAVGKAPRDEKIDPIELAALTMIASAILNLDESLTRG